MNGAECGSCGKIQCTCDRYPGELAYLRHQLEESYSIEYKQSLALKGILMVLTRIESTKELKDTDMQALNEFKNSCGLTHNDKRWWQFWK